MVLYRLLENLYLQVSGSSVEFLILYVDNILLIGNDIEFSGKHKGVFEKSFFKERPW